ncbi:MAG: hypothetical protein FWC78_06685 [Defluviitaleaceae bacterium]|nr:hypothetical protein [Defluviitaleaceae bacterium]
MTEKLKLKIEDTISDLFDGEIRGNLLSFIAYLRENKMNPSRSSAVSYKISCKGFVVGYIRVNNDDGTLLITPFLDVYDSASLPDGLKEIVWAKKRIGRPCGEGCHKCSHILDAIFGKEYDDACGQSVSFMNPSASELECIKELLTLRRDTIKSGKAKCGIPINYGK